MLIAKLFSILFLSNSPVQAAMPMQILRLDLQASISLYQVLAIPAEDHDDILRKTISLTSSKFNIACEWYVVDQTASCVLTYPERAFSFGGEEAKALSDALDIPSKVFHTTSFDLYCLRFNDQTHTCALDFTHQP